MRAPRRPLNHATVQLIPRLSFHSAYKDTKIYPSFQDYVENRPKTEAPHAIFIGSPAKFHGSDVPGADLELQCLKYFPDAGVFVEKPISASPVQNTVAVANAMEERDVVCSVGYMVSRPAGIMVAGTVADPRDTASLLEGCPAHEADPRREQPHCCR